MVEKKAKISKVRIWFVFVVLFLCGAFVGIGIANFGHSKAKQGINTDTEQNVGTNWTSCQAIENVLLDRLFNHDNDCDAVKNDLDTYTRLQQYGCEENRDRYIQEINNKKAILGVACEEYVKSDAKPCEEIEANLNAELPSGHVGVSANQRIDRAKIYAIMAEKGCPENTIKYTNMAKQELDIARAIRDDDFSERDTLEVVETYKRLKMQQDAEEMFNKVKKLTNPAIDFILQVEKIINE